MLVNINIMTQEDKDLLLKDLCGRLPYGVIVAYKSQEKEGRVKLGYGNIGYVAELGRSWWIECKPYLRPMSSMTEEEKEELYHYYCNEIADNLNTPNLTWEVRCCVSNSFGTDWLNAHHFDYRGLIERGLALEAPKDMYNIKQKQLWQQNTIVVDLKEKLNFMVIIVQDALFFLLMQVNVQVE